MFTDIEIDAAIAALEECKMIDDIIRDKMTFANNSREYHKIKCIMIAEMLKMAIDTDL